MRKLFAHPLHALTASLNVLLVISLFTVGVQFYTFALPLPLGQLSDYGNVLDRYGRERINGLIDGAYQRHRIEVYILVSWENPYDDTGSYARALLDAWRLASRKAFLAVFLKMESQWSVQVVAGSGLTSEHPLLAERLEADIANLVQHGRIEEAMVALFDSLEQELIKDSTPSEALRDGTTTRLVLVLLLIAATVILGLFIHRRVCPRCGRILRTRAAGMLSPYDRHIVVYYCRRCGYSRSREERAKESRR